jgi:uncharacterized protein YbaR (Trm112 family)/SAM-dependent methyltransferase
VKTRLLDFLACPECSAAPFSLDAFSCDGDEVMDGVLLCPACGRTYPVIGGVPRLLPDALIGALATYHPAFFQRYSVIRRSASAQDDVGRTLTFYSYARAKLFTSQPAPELLAYWRKSLATRIPAMSELSGRFGLDAGCGEGRYTYCLTEAGAEVVGLDLSEAVNLAHQRNRHNPRAHIVQGSIYQPPFRHGIFDFVLSTGVLHHLPDPRRGFEVLVPLLRAGGSMHVWVYGLRKMNLVYRLSHLTFLRRFGSRLPPRASYLLSVPLALGLHLLVFQPLRLLARSAATRDRINPQLGELAALPLWMHVAEVQDRIGVPITHFLTGEEVRAWLGQAGLGQVTVDATDGGRGWSARGFLSG